MDFEITQPADRQSAIKEPFDLVVQCLGLTDAPHSKKASTTTRNDPIRFVLVLIFLFRGRFNRILCQPGRYDKPPLFQIRKSDGRRP